MRIKVLGVPFDNLTMDEAVSAALDLVLDDKKPSYIVTANAEMVYETRRNTGLFDVIQSADMVVADGAGVVLGAKILKTPLKQKVAGVELAAQLAVELAKNGKSLYLLGAKPGIAEIAANNLQKSSSNLIVAGISDGYFTDENAVIQAIKDSKADVLYVGLGSPRQEQFISKNLENTGVSLAIGVGGSFDIYAGTLKRAPKWMISASLEWLYRLLCEPTRFWRMCRLPAFILAVLRHGNER